MKHLLLLLLFASPATSLASIPACNPRITLSSDHTRLLVMFTPINPWLDANGNPLPEPPPIGILPNGQTVNLRDTFKKPGVYDAATLAPIWQVDWYAEEGNLLLSDDFRYAAYRNVYGAYSGWAIAFYDQGRLVRSYDCAQLLTGLRSFIPLTSAGWHYRWYADFTLSADGKNVHLSTVRRRVYLFDHVIDLGLQEHYTFNLTTGAIVTQRTTGAWWIGAYAAAALALIVLPLTALRFFWRRAKSSARLRRGFPMDQPAASRASVPFS